MNKNFPDTANSSIQLQIVQYLADKLSNTPGFSEVDDYHRCLLMFKNFRLTRGRPVGLKLTPAGKSLLDKFFIKYEYPINDMLSPRILLSLDRNMTWPYYVTNQKIVFYSQSDAAWFKLSGGGLDSFVSCI